MQAPKGLLSPNCATFGKVPRVYREYMVNFGVRVLQLWNSYVLNKVKGFRFAKFDVGFSDWVACNQVPIMLLVHCVIARTLYLPMFYRRIGKAEVLRLDIIVKIQSIKTLLYLQIFFGTNLITFKSLTMHLP